MEDFSIRQIIKQKNQIENQISILISLKECDVDIDKTAYAMDIYTPLNVSDIEERIRLLKVYLVILNERIDETCPHTFVTDSVDISHEEARLICYCELCGKSC